MEEILLELSHELPFTNISSEFPDTRILRWCNSYADYLEFTGRKLDEEKIVARMTEFAESIGSRVIFHSGNDRYISVMVSCRCSIQNSTVRITESMDCVVKNPVVYEGSHEYLGFVSIRPEDFRKLYGRLSEFSDIEIKVRKAINPEDFRNLWTISLSELFSGMTDKQAGILSDAISHGYFDIPKRMMIDSLAQKHGISKSTMQEHLSKAESRLMHSMDSYLHLYREYMGKPETE